MSNEKLTEKTLADVQAGIPARDAEIEALRKENEQLREAINIPVSAEPVDDRVYFDLSIEPALNRLEVLERAIDTDPVVAEPGDFNLDQQRLVLWQAINSIKIGNKWDDKLILSNLHKAGYVISSYAAVAAQAQPEGVTLGGCLETLFRLGEYLGVDYAASRKAPGAPSGVYIKAIEEKELKARDAALEEAAVAMEQTSRQGGALVIRAIKSGSEAQQPVSGADGVPSNDAIESLVKSLGWMDYDLGDVVELVRAAVCEFSKPHSSGNSGDTELAEDNLLSRLRIHHEDKRNTAFSRSTMLEALQYIERAALAQQDVDRKDSDQ